MVASLPLLNVPLQSFASFPTVAHNDLVKQFDILTDRLTGIHGCSRWTETILLSRLRSKSDSNLSLSWLGPKLGPQFLSWQKRSQRHLSFCKGLVRAENKCECHDLSRHLVPYVDAWEWQKAAVEARLSALNNGTPLCDTVLLLQHPPVYTLGTRSTLDNVLFDASNPPAEIYRTERGGEVTYHGPGQLVMYPILDLRNQQMDLHWYLRSLEEVIIRALKTSCGIVGERVEGMTGVWADGCKVAAIGVRVSRWVTYHGLALNVSTDLSPFKEIIPCGLHFPVGSVSSLIRPKTELISASPTKSTDDIHRNRQNQLEYDKLIRTETLHGSSKSSLSVITDADLLDLLSRHLLAAMGEIFSLDFVPPTTKGPEVRMPL